MTKTPENTALKDDGGRNAFRISKKRTMIDIAILIASGLAMGLAMPGMNIVLFSYISIIPLIWLASARSMKRAFVYGFIWGYAWSFMSTFFLREIMFFIPFAFAAILGLFSAFFAMMIPFICKNILYPAKIRREGAEAVRKFYNFSPVSELIATFTLASCWVALEWIRSWIATGFPWNLLSSTQWENTALIQICEFTGIYGVSFIVIFINIAAFFAIRGFRYSLPENRYKRPFPLLAGVLILIAASSIGSSRYEKLKKQYANDSIFVGIGVVQPHLSQRRFATDAEVTEALNECLLLTDKLIAYDDAFRSSGSDYPDEQELRKMSPDELARHIPLDIIVWPESAVPVSYYFNHPFPYREEVRKRLAESKIPFLVGTGTAKPIPGTIDEYQFFNTALLLKDSDTKRNPFYDNAGEYSKVHIVPFGEYVPFADKFPQINRFLGMGRNLTPGDGFTPLKITPYVSAGVMICYEDVFPYIGRAQAANGAQLLLVVTNDAWYPKSTEPEQHYVNSLFRTIETRLPMVRAGNSDYSVYIDPFGRLVDSVSRTYLPDGTMELSPGLKQSQSTKFAVAVPRNYKPTFYVIYGDIFVLLCWIVFTAGTIYALILRAFYWRSLKHPVEDVREKIRREFLESGKKK